MADKNNKELVRDGIREIWGEGKLDRIDHYFASDVMIEDPMGSQKGPKAMREQVSMMRQAFPDMRVSVDSVIGEGDIVAYSFTVTGTHRGRLQSIEPSGRQVTVKGVGLSKIKNGKVIHDHSQWDLFGLMVQIGAISPPEFMESGAGRGAQA
ncbi:MAG: ester cyclase [Bradymonadaceae bacterium]|nr:ester cyclase [Lujinxingiaceae bacterium]